MMAEKEGLYKKRGEITETRVRFKIGMCNLDGSILSNTMLAQDTVIKMFLLFFVRICYDFWPLRETVIMTVANNHIKFKHNYNPFRKQGLAWCYKMQ